MNLVGCVERTRERLLTGEVGTERTYYIASLKTPSVEQLAHAARAHWEIENRLHWVLEPAHMAFDEDHSRARTKNSAQNFALVRKIALNLLRLDKKTKAGMRTKRNMCNLDHDHDHLLRMLKGARTLAAPGAP